MQAFGQYPWFWTPKACPVVTLSTLKWSRDIWTETTARQMKIFGWRLGFKTQHGTLAPVSWVGPHNTLRTSWLSRTFHYSLQRQMGMIHRTHRERSKCFWNGHISATSVSWLPGQRWFQDSNGQRKEVEGERSTICPSKVCISPPNALFIQHSFPILMLGPSNCISITTFCPPAWWLWGGGRVPYLSRSRG